MKKFAYSLIIASLTNGLVAYQAAAATMDPLTTAQSVKTTSGNPAQSTESTTNLLGDSRIAALYPPAGAKASITIGGGEAKYE